jgi:hypothetical protein
MVILMVSRSSSCFLGPENEVKELYGMNWFSIFGLPGVVDKDSRGCVVPLRGFCGKARGGGGRLRQATPARVSGREEEAR